MDLQDILSSYQLSPEAEERFSKEVIENLKGSVRIDFGEFVLSLIVVTILGALEELLFVKVGGLVGMLTMIVYLLGAILFLWYLLSWQLDFDGSTGFLNYHTLFQGTTAYHVDELMCYDIRTQRWKRTTFESYGEKLTLAQFLDNLRARRTFRIRELLQIRTSDGSITIPLSTAWLSSKLIHGVGGFRDADKLSHYLELYRRYLLKADAVIPVQTPEEALSPAVLMAIEEEKRRSREAVSENTEPEQKPEASKAPQPAPHKPEPATAAPEKPAVDVDKLFESVLRQHGKIK